MWPPMKHYEKVDQLVLRWDVNKPIDKDDIPGHIEEVLQEVLGQKQPSTAGGASVEGDDGNQSKGASDGSGVSGSGWVGGESEKQKDPEWTNTSEMPAVRPKPPPAMMGLVTDVNLARNQPMAYVTLASADFVDLLSKSEVKDPPFMWPPMKHY